MLVGHLLSFLSVAASSDSVFLVGELPDKATKLRYLLGQYDKSSEGDYRSASQVLNRNTGDFESLVLWHEKGWWKASSMAKRNGEKARSLAAEAYPQHPTHAVKGAWTFAYEDDGYHANNPAPNIRCLSGAEGETELLSSVALKVVYLHGANPAGARSHPPLAFSRVDGAGAGERHVYSINGGLRSMWYAEGYWYVGATKQVKETLVRPAPPASEVATRPGPTGFYYRVKDAALLPEYISGTWQVFEANADESTWKDVPMRSHAGTRAEIGLRCDGDGDKAKYESLKSLEWEVQESTASYILQLQRLGAIDTSWSLARNSCGARTQA